MLSICINVILVVVVLLNTQMPKIQYSDEVLKDFSLKISKQCLTFNSVSLASQIDSVQQYLGVDVLKSLLDDFKKHEELIAENEIQQEFKVTNISVVRSEEPYLLEIAGIRRISSGQIDNVDESAALTYTLEVQRVEITRKNPYGLEVINIIENRDQLSEVES